MIVGGQLEPKKSRGTDLWTVEWCHDNAVQCEIYRPYKDEIDKFGKGAWPMRNSRMVDILSTYDAAFHDLVVLAQPDNVKVISAGTKDTVYKAIASDLDVLLST